MQEAYAHCAQEVREGDRDRFLAALFAPPERRPSLHALYAFDLETARVPSRVRDPMAGEVRLQWWRDVLDGLRAAEAIANPVAAALIDTINRHALPRPALQTLLDARSGDLYVDPVETLAQLENDARNTAGVILRLAAQILEARGGGVIDRMVEHAALATGLADMLTRIPAQRARGKFALPLDVLQRHGVDRDEAWAGRVTPALHAALAELRAAARTHVDAVGLLFSQAPRAVRPAFLHVIPIPLALDRMERRGYDPFTTVIEVPAWRRQWRLWRAARRA